MLRAVLAGIRQRPAKLLLTGVSIVVATVFSAGVFLLTDTISAGLRSSAQEMPQAVAAVVDARSGLLPPDALNAVRAVPGVADATPVSLTVVGLSLHGEAPTEAVVKEDPGQGPLSQERLVSGAAPAGAGQVAVAQATASAFGLKVGDRVTLAAAGKPGGQFTVTGVVADSRSDGATTTVLDPQGFGQLTSDGPDHIYVAAAPGVSQAELVRRLEQLPGVTVQSGDAARAAEVRDNLRGMDEVFALLEVFVGIAMVAALLVVSSTFRIMVTQRRRQTALWRCVGATRGQVLRAMLAEAGLTGFVAGVLGVGLAILLGYGLLAVLGSGQSMPPLQISWGGMALCLVEAVVVTVVAAIAPALASTRVAPVAALGSAGAADAGQARRGVRIVISVLLAAVAALLIAVGLAAGRGNTAVLLVYVVSGFFAFGTLMVSGPLLLPLIARLIGVAVGAVGRVPGRVAVGNALRTPKRTAAATVVLALGAMLVSGVLVGVASLRASVAAKLGGSAADHAALDKVINEMTLIALGLVGMTVLVAVVGVGTTLSLSVVERTRESGLLRALGMPRGGVSATLSWEAVVFGGCAVVPGLLLGCLYGALAIRSIGSFTVVSIPFGQLAILVAGLLALALLAALAPARRAGKAKPLEALSVE